MDETILRLAAYGRSLAFDQFDADTVHQAKRRVIDTLGAVKANWVETASVAP